jgi:hypothetical protein
LFQGKKRIEKYTREFNTFLISAFDKLKRHNELFGKSIILRELVLRYQDRLSIITGDRSKDLVEISPKNPEHGKYNVFLALYMLLNIVMGVVLVFSLFNFLGGDTWLESISSDEFFYTMFSIHFILLEIPLLIKFVIIAAPVMCYMYYPSFLKKRTQVIAAEYYKALADLYRS